ncbi:MAG TPA: hypothetical protein VM325_18245 [Alphaproteobacteria bacterium]|nr:hypothetical protein [Alphaproteobacteria bacterium]
MAAKDPAANQSVLSALDWAREKAAPYLTWLPDWLEPHAVDVIGVLVLLAAAYAVWKKFAELWSLVIWLARKLWRWKTGYKPPKREIVIAVERKIDELRGLITAQAENAEEGGQTLSEDAIDRAVAAAQEVLSSNDPLKADAQEALRKGDVQAAEAALETAFEREVEAAMRIGDEAAQLKAKAARTAREKAALAATRSVAEAIRWYRKASELEPKHPWTQIELARLYKAGGNLSAAAKAARAAHDLADEDRDRSVALDEIGDVLRWQGDLGKALESYLASMVIAERLAKADASNAALQRDLSVSHNKIGDVRLAQGDLGKALESHQASMVIREHLAKADASNAALQRDLSVSHERIGDLNEVRGEFAGAVEAYESSHVIARSLAMRFPDHMQFQSDLKITERRLAELRAAAIQD